MRYMLVPYGCGRIHLSLCVFFLDKIAIYKIEGKLQVEFEQP